MSSMRLGPRCLPPEEYARQKARGVGTNRAAFRLGPRILRPEVAAVTAIAPPEVVPAAKAEAPALTGLAKARAAKAAKAAAKSGAGK